MFLSILSASFGYLDIALIVLLVLALIIGLVRGVSKSLKGFLLSIPIVLLSIFLVGVSFEPAKTFKPFVMMHDALAQASAGWGDVFNSDVMIDTDSQDVVLIVNGEKKTFDEVDPSLKGKIAKLIASKTVEQNPGESIAAISVEKLNSVLILIILFVAFCIALSIIFALIRRITAKMHYSENGFVKALDRIFGGLFSIVMMAIFVCVVFAIISAIPAAAPAQDFINENLIGGFIMQKNPISIMFNNIFVSI